jgi:hypothetical protein
MNTAIVYILTSLFLAIILASARSEPRQKLDDEFRYQPALIKVLLICSFVPIVAVAFIYTVARSKPSGASLALFILGGVSGTGLFLYGYKYFKSLVVSVRDEGVAVISIKGERLIPFNAVKKVIYLCPAGHGGMLCLYGDRNRKLIQFSETISGVENIARLIQSRSMRYGIPFEVRDRRS